MDLRAKAINGVKWTTLSTVVGTILQLLQLAILARFLDSSDFGLMALVMIVIGFSQAFLDMGISNAIIHKQEVTHEQLSTLYWVNVLAGFILFIIISLLAPFVSDFYNEPKLTELILIVGVTFLIQPFGQQFMVLWQKEMRFSAIAKIDIVNKLIALVVSVYLAYMGYGVYALVYGTLAGVVTQTVQFIYIGLKEHKPSLIFRIGDIKEFLGFGAYQMGEKSINYISANIDKILIGKFIGMEALGFYNLAWQLIIFPLSKINPIVNRVAFPLYAKVQNDIAKLSNYYGQSVKALSLITIPLLVYMSIYSQEIIYIMYGSGWELSATLLSILAFSGMIKALGNPGGAILLALGRVDVGFWWNLAWAILLTSVLIISMNINSDIINISYILLILIIFITPIWHRIIYNISNVEYRSIIVHFIKILISSFVIAYISVIILKILNIEDYILRVVLSSIISILFYRIYLLKFEKNILNKLKKIKKNKGK